ncbi:hypothetical protein ACFYW6_40245 [Streptomyces sp. NPDC002659]|uniref:hypothetical protein n=1 Tax=Streptomyces sp. NPDC002659 TaxID=3364656 RepID=UPI00367ED4F9
MTTPYRAHRLRNDQRQTPHKPTAATGGSTPAIYRTVIVRMRFHQPTIDYVARRTAEGKIKREIIRCLKRYVIREVYHLLRPPHERTSATS